MNRQNTSHLLLVRPAAFGFNPETAQSNSFQQWIDPATAQEVHESALAEFDNYADLLRKNELDVVVFQDTPGGTSPDAIFPNNWISTHASGQVILYPMHATNRRRERRLEVLQLISKQYKILEIIDMSHFESMNKYLEGTGSMVLDRVGKIAYTALSSRSHLTVLNAFCAKLGYESVPFSSVDRGGKEVYHTNVVMNIGENFGVVCLDSIHTAAEIRFIEQSFEKSGREFIPISLSQMENFVGNMLEVVNRKGEKLLLLSQSALDALLPGQVSKLEKHVRLLPGFIPTIEKAAGGSVRCMIAEIFLPLKE